MHTNCLISTSRKNPTVQDVLLSRVILSASFFASAKSCSGHVPCLSTILPWRSVPFTTYTFADVSRTSKTQSASSSRLSTSLGIYFRKVCSQVQQFFRKFPNSIWITWHTNLLGFQPRKISNYLMPRFFTNYNLINGIDIVIIFIIRFRHVCDPYRIPLHEKIANYLVPFGNRTCPDFGHGFPRKLL